MTAGGQSGMCLVQILGVCPHSAGFSHIVLKVTVEIFLGRSGLPWEYCDRVLHLAGRLAGRKELVLSSCIPSFPLLHSHPLPLPLSLSFPFPFFFFIFFFSFYFSLSLFHLSFSFHLPFPFHLLIFLFSFCLCFLFSFFLASSSLSILNDLPGSPASSRAALCSWKSLPASAHSPLPFIPSSHPSLQEMWSH